MAFKGVIQGGIQVGMNDKEPCIRLLQVVLLYIIWIVSTVEGWTN